MSANRSVRVGVVFGGRSSEHEVSLASARNVMDALDQAGYTVVPIGITPQGRWLTGGNPLALLTDGAYSSIAPFGAPAGNGAHASGQSTVHTSVQAGVNEGDHEGAQEDTQENNDSWALLPTAMAGASKLPTIDVIFPVLHGPYGEDGTIQGMLEMANVPYVGCGVLASALCMDKAMAKQIFAAHNLRQIPYIVVLRSSWQRDSQKVQTQIESQLQYPLFVKPANMGSSVGVSKVHDAHELAPAIDLAAAYDRKILIEEAVPNAREIEVSVLGGETPMASVPGEIIPAHEFYDYDAKYINDASKLLIPAPLTPAQQSDVQAMAVTAFRAVDASGLARVDFLMDGQSDQFYLNEINTMPGFTRISMYPKLWEQSGIGYPELVHRLVQLALEQYADRQQNRTSR